MSKAVLLLLISLVVADETVVPVNTSGSCHLKNKQLTCDEEGYTCVKFGTSEYCLANQGNYGDYCTDKCNPGLICYEGFCVRKDLKETTTYVFNLFIKPSKYKTNSHMRRTLKRVERKKTNRRRFK